MSKADNIQKKLWKAYGKVAKVLGREFDVMRTDLTSDPICDTNVISRQLASFSKDDKYNKPQGTEVPVWKCWVDGRLENLFDIRRGDYLHDWERDETYLIVTDHPHLTLQALLVNSRVTVASSGYTDTGDGFAPGDTEVAIDLPCYINQPSSGSGTLGYIPGANNASVGIPNYEIYLIDPEGLIEIGNAITDQDGNRSQVLAVYNTESYTKVVTKAYEAA